MTEFILTEAERLLLEMIEGCPVCSGKGYVRMIPTHIIARAEFSRSCDYCTKARLYFSPIKKEEDKNDQNRI